MNRIFLLCPRCGNLIEMINDSGVTPICCGTDMLEIKANEMDAAVEKHVPVIATKDNIVTVTVGETLHPMEENHYIAWIYLKTNKGVKRASLKPGASPIATFTITPDEEVIEAYAYCNLHGLWKKQR